MYSDINKFMLRCESWIRWMYVKYIIVDGMEQKRMELGMEDKGEKF